MASGLGSTLNIPVTTSQVALAIIHLPWSFKPGSDTPPEWPSSLSRTQFLPWRIKYLYATLWHHWLNGHEFEQTLAHSEWQRSLVCCSPWNRRIRLKSATETITVLHPIGRSLKAEIVWLGSPSGLLPRAWHLLCRWAPNNYLSCGWPTNKERRPWE